MRDFVPRSRRNSEPKPRIHEELTETARIRLANILREMWKSHIEEAHDHLVNYTGQEIPDFDLQQESRARSSLQEFIKTEEGDDLIWDYLEYLLNVAWSDNSPFRSSEDVIDMAADIEKVLIEEGILVQMKPSVDEMRSYDSYRPNEDEYVKFQQVADETIIETDQELRVLALGDRWKKPLSGYNEAWNLYQDDTLTYVIAEKLYNSLEAVVRKICVELEDWESEDASVGTCLGTMRQKGLFEPNDTMVGEWQQIYGGLQTGVQKLGSDRKRHEEIDQDYAVLLLHQTSAFLTFVIKRYEEKYG